MSAYDIDRQWSDRFIQPMKQIIGPLLLEPSSFEIDTKQATDLVVMRARDHMIAARVRRAGYADRYPYEFTIRSARDSGAKTEISKIIDGFADWMFYGHAAANGVGFDRWFVINLHSFRAALIRDIHSIVYHEKSNYDGTHFVSFDVRSFPAHTPILIAASHQVPALNAA